MGSTKTCTTVSLLKRIYPSGKVSLYLDFYPAIRNPRTGKKTRREYLGIYLYAKPRTNRERKFNIEMLEKAEAIRCQRFTMLLNEQFGFLDKTKMKGDFLEWFKEKCRHNNQKWTRVYDHFYNFTGGQCTFNDISAELCNRFKVYLLNAKQLKHTNKSLMRNSAAGYFSTFRGALRQAFLEKMLKENVNDYLEPIELEAKRKEYLTLDEVKLLSESECDIPVLKAASVFSCLTGLRISDILNLRWNNIVEDHNIGNCIRIRTQKTQTEATLPISDEALALCGERSEGKVFKGLNRGMIGKALKEWIKSVGITKRITFHCFRHTFATLQVAAGTDIYTVSKLLTHKNVTTTQIYADLVSSVQREAVNRLSLKKKSK